MAEEEIRAGVEAVGLSDDAGQKLKLDQSTLFHSVEVGNVPVLQALLHSRKVDVNAYNDEGFTALHLAVWKYEDGRNLEVAKTLLRHGANAGLKAAPSALSHKFSITRHDAKHPHGDLLGTKKITFGHKTPLLVSLELKSALYLKGWEYRHWDDMLKLLSDATIQQYSNKKIPSGPREQVAVVQRNWAHVFQSGKHELVEVWAEGKYLTALKLLLAGASPVLKSNLEEATALHSNRLEIKDASFNVVKAIVFFVYTGQVDPHFMDQRGLDLLLAAHKHGIESLIHLCEVSIHATQDNWVKLLTVATQCNSDVLTLTCAQSIKAVMEKRQDGVHFLKKSFSDAQDGPSQLFHKPSFVP